MDSLTVVAAPEPTALTLVGMAGGTALNNRRKRTSRLKA